MSTANSLVRALSISDRGALGVTWHNGQSSEFHPIWLRERLPESGTVRSRTGERLIMAPEIPLDIRVDAATVRDSDILVEFNDRSTSAFAAAFLFVNRGPKGDRSLAPATKVEGSQPLALERILGSEDGLKQLLNRLENDGYVIVTGLPLDRDAMLLVSDLIAPLQEDHWATIGDVAISPQATDISLTEAALAPHTDEPYKVDAPGYVLLHCIENSCPGGETTLADGIRAAEILRDRDPKAFETLSKVWVQFRYHDGDITLEERSPVIVADDTGRITQVRFSNSQEFVESRSFSQMSEYYDARQKFWRLVEPSGNLSFRAKLVPGDLLIIDNFRMLHGRNAFTSSVGKRWLRHGCLSRDAIRLVHARIGSLLEVGIEPLPYPASEIRSIAKEMTP